MFLPYDLGMARMRFGEQPEWAMPPGWYEAALKAAVEAPVPEDMPEDLFCCGHCGATLWLAGHLEVEHDCATGEVAPA
jgi:hypothetical protein